MKINYTLRYAFLAVVLMLTTSAVFSSVKWYGDTDKDYLESFYRLSKETGETATVSVQTIAPHGKVWAVNKPSGSKRSELARTNGYIPAEGDKIFVGWESRIVIAGSSNPSGFAMFQLKSEDPHSQNYPVTMGYNGSKITVDAYDPGSGSQASRRKILCEFDVAEGEWVSIVLGIKFSRDANVGYVEVWVNGVKQDLLNDNTNKQTKHRTLDDNGNYFKWGAYNEESRDFDITHYLDEMRVATTFSEANPATYEAHAYTDDIVSVTAPTSVQAGSNANLTVNYSSSTNRDVIVNFQLDATPWTSYQTVKKDVSAGTGTLNFSVPIPSSTPVANDQYQFQTYITTNGGDWSNKIDNIAKNNVDVTSGGGSIAGIYNLKNVATNMYLDSDGSAVKVGTSSSGADKQWSLIPSSGVFFNIDCEYAGRGVLDSDGGGVVFGNTIEGPVTTDDKEWKPISLGGNIYRFENAVSGRGYLSANTSTKVVGSSTSTGNDTKWELIYISALKSASIVAGEINKAASVKLYPNPTSSNFTIQLNQMENATISITNMNGKTVYKTTTNQSSIDISTTDKFAAGIYLVNIRSNNNNFTKKLIVR